MKSADALSSALSNTSVGLAALCRGLLAILAVSEFLLTLSAALSSALSW